MAKLYFMANGPAPTTASFAAVTTGTAIKRMLQVKPVGQIAVVEWGISFDGTAAAAPILVELAEFDAAATVTASVLADGATQNIVPYDPNATSVSTVSVGTTATGYTSSNENTVARVRLFDVQQVPPTGSYVKQFPLGREPYVAPAKFLGIRVKAAAAVNCYCYVVWEE
jgi:hypothetical protein